jgi:hypothetical protein
MEKVTILDDQGASLWYHPESGVVHHKLHAFPASGLFRKLLEASAELVEKHHAAKYLSDDRDNLVVDPEDIKWAEQNWYPRVVKAGLRRWALVMPSSVVGTLQAKGIIEHRRRQGLEVEGFDNVEAAMAWLARKA